MQVVDLGTMAGTNVDAFVRNVINTEDMPNGSFVVMTGQSGREIDLFTVATPTDVTTQDVLLVHSPELVEINGYRIGLGDMTLFTNKANIPARAYHLKEGDTFTITDDGITGATTVGQFVAPVNGAYKPSASATKGTSRLVLRVLEKKNITIGTTRLPATRLQVIQNG